LSLAEIGPRAAGGGRREREPVGFLLGRAAIMAFGLCSHMPKEPKPDDVTFHEETDSPVYADDRNFYKVEKWTKEGTKVDRLLYAGNSLGRAQ
jgi:hypothetical protein